MGIVAEDNVFISYKATENGLRTPDAAIAEELYNNLSKCEGIRPFWDREELKNGQENADFGKSIYAALESAKIFVFVHDGR